MAFQQRDSPEFKAADGGDVYFFPAGICAVSAGKVLGYLCPPGESKVASAERQLFVAECCFVRCGGCRDCWCAGWVSQGRPVRGLRFVRFVGTGWVGNADRARVGNLPAACEGQGWAS